MKNIIFLKAAEKYLNKQPTQVTARILLAIYQLPKGNTMSMKNSDVSRLRIGDIRVIYEIQGNQITIHNIGNRGDVYK